MRGRRERAEARQTWRRFRPTVFTGISLEDAVDVVVADDMFLTVGAFPHYLGISAQYCRCLRVIGNQYQRRFVNFVTDLNTHAGIACYVRGPGLIIGSLQVHTMLVGTDIEPPVADERYGPNRMQ